MHRNPTLNRAAACYLGIAVAVTLVALSVIHLDAQGAYYDELHQAPASFEYLGKRSPMFNHQFHGIPILNTTYSGAIKSNLYGLYLKYVNPHFTIYSWRLFGIVFLAIGLFAFYQIAGPLLSLGGAVVFGALLLTDASVILTNRHDLGPIALAFCFRLVFIAVWMSIEFSEPARWKYFMTGLIAGVAIFEKLSSVVLLAPLFLLLLTSPKRRLRFWMASASGLLLVGLPLLLLNVATFAYGHGFISLRGVGESVYRLSVAAYVSRYLELGQGDQARRLILGDSASSALMHWEKTLLVVVLLTIAVAAVRLRGRSRLMVLSGLMAVSYVAVGICVYLLPRTTFVHHWILGTPFQYASIALALAAFMNRTQQQTREGAFYKHIFLVAMIVLLAVRVPSIVGLEESLVSRNASTAFHPSLTRLAEMAASRSKDAAFIAADWGTATQVYCVGNGQDDLVYEPFWNTEPGERVLKIAATTKKDSLYTLATGIGPEFQQASASILRSMASLPGWQEAPVEMEFANLSPIHIRKFVRRTDR